VMFGVAAVDDAADVGFDDGGGEGDDDDEVVIHVATMVVRKQRGVVHWGCSQHLPPFP